MNVKNFDELLSEYNAKLNKISKTDITYKISINQAAIIFFEGINKLDKNILEYYFKNINTENINENDVQKDAFNCLFILTIKNTSNVDFFVRFFPEYLESESTAKSKWFIMRWLQFFISWFKPQFKLNNLPDAIRMLNALRDVKHRLESDKNNLFDVNLEIESYKAFSFIVEKFLENKVLPLIYTPINEQNLLKDWFVAYVLKLKSAQYNKEFLEKYSEKHLEIDTLLKYLKYKIKLLVDSDEKIKLLNEYIKLQDFVYKKEFSSFEEKIYEVKEFIKSKLIQENSVKIQSIYNLLNGIKERLRILCEFNDETDLIDSHPNYLTAHFKQLLNSRMDKIRFYYETYRKNLDQQVELCYGNTPKFYEILNKLESSFYSDKSLFLHTSSQEFSSSNFANLSASLQRILILAKDLENCATGMDPKSLESDLHKLSQFVLEEILFLQSELAKEIEEHTRLSAYDSDEDDEWNEEWDAASNISEIPDVEQLEQEENVNITSVFITSADRQSDSGISDEEENNLDHHTRTTQLPITTPFWQDSFNRQKDQFVIANAEGARQSMDGHAHYIRSP